MKAKPQIITKMPQPKAALAAAAMPAQNNQVKPSTAPVHLGETFGATPNPNATRPATVAAIGNPYGGNAGTGGRAARSCRIDGHREWLKSGSNTGTLGKVASAGIPGASGTAPQGNYGKVAAVAMPTATQVAAAPKLVAAPSVTSLEVLSKPPVQYTAEARQMHIEGDVVLNVTFLANGQVVVHGIVRGLGHGLDEEARRVAQQIRFPSGDQRRPGRWT